MGNRIWDSYYKFCFERNPYDKIISWYYHWKGAGKTSDESIDNFIKNGGLRLIVNFDMYSINHQIAVDDIFKFEEINKSLEVISSKINLDHKLEMPTYKAKSNSRLDKRPYKEVIDEDIKKAIDLAFAREIKLLNYKF